MFVSTFFLGGGQFGGYPKFEFWTFSNIKAISSESQVNSLPLTNFPNNLFRHWKHHS